MTATPDKEVVSKNDKLCGAPTLFEVWKEYQESAKHFNDLILRLRVQALGGVAGLSAVLGFVGKDLPGTQFRDGAMAIAFAVLTIFWVAMAILDLFYYNRLLLGAVDAILEIEALSASGSQYVSLDLSSRIKGTVEGKGRNWRTSQRAPIAFYLIILLVLVGLSCFTYSRTTERSEQEAKNIPSQTES